MSYIAGTIISTTGMIVEKHRNSKHNERRRIQNIMFRKFVHITNNICLASDYGAKARLEHRHHNSGKILHLM